MNGENKMNNFDKIKDDFVNADVDEKINIYVSADGLTRDQYMELLRLFPLEDLYRLEEALK